MSEKAIADSSFLVAVFDRNDVWHEKAHSLGINLDAHLIYLDCVLNEVFSVICKRAVEKNKGPLVSGIINDIQISIPDKLITWTYPEISGYYSEILSLVKQHSGRLNFHDCLIALAARERDITSIISFDKDFDEIPWLRRIGPED